MKFKIERKTMQDIIGKVGKAITGKIGNPILDGMYIKAEEGKLTFIGSDGETTIRTTVDAEITQAGSIVVEPRILGEIIRKLPDADVTMFVENNILQIKCSKSEYNLVCNSTEDYPANILEQTINSDVCVEIEQNKLKNLVKSVHFAASESEARPILKGILLEVKDSKINLVTLDGYRLAMKNAEIDSETEASVVVDAKLLNDICKIFNDTDDIVSIYIGGNQIAFKFDETSVILRLIEGNFIAYESLIPSESTHIVEVNRKNMIDAINRVSVMFDGQNKLVKLEFTENVAFIESKSQLGKVKEDLELDRGVTETLSIAFNGKFMLDMLNAIEDDFVKLNLTSPVSPCVATGVTDTSGKYLLLPVRLTR